MTGPRPDGAGPLQRARFAALAYRQALATADVDACVRLDKSMLDWGETWAVPRLITYRLDDWLSVRDAADLAAVKVTTLRLWRARGRLVEGEDWRRVWHTGRWHWEYLAASVLAMSTQIRQRTKRGGG